MGEWIEGGGLGEVDGVSFGLWMPTITALALEDQEVKEEGQTNADN